MTKEQEYTFKRIKDDLSDAEFGADPADSIYHLINAIANLSGIVRQLAETQSNQKTQTNRTRDRKSKNNDQ